VKKTRQSNVSTFVTPDLIALYKKRAARLRVEACRATWRLLWNVVSGIARQR
jgi:hypothetical protein